MSGQNLVVTGGAVLDPVSGSWETRDVAIRDGVVVPGGDAPSDARRIDASGRFVLPGLIDCHVHVLAAATADLGAVGEMSPNYVALAAARTMGEMLDRGFTTVRDVGGGDFGLQSAQAEGLVRGPRLFFGGKALSQTGGHGDTRHRGRQQFDAHACCPSISRLADGVDEVRRAARDELRKGADHIKIMVSGGVASPTDRIDSTQYSMDEIRAVVEEAEAANRYVAAHAYTARAILRALEGGVRSIEHGNLMDQSVVDALKEHDAFVTMNLVTYWALQEEGREHGLPADQYAKIEAVLSGGVEALKLAHAAGVIPAYGSDLLGGMQRHQAREFAIRAEHVDNIDVIRSATTVAARLLQREGELGVLTAGARGDLVIVDGDPLQDMEILAAGTPRQVVQDGAVVVGEGAAGHP
ncbi:metal-dependent hydrolase family protein [Mariniluteicoccus flavus]